MKRHDAKTAKESEEPDRELDRWAHQVVGAALEVHRTLGPGFLESIYEQALCAELLSRAVPFRRQVPIAVRYKGQIVGQGQLDLLIGQRPGCRAQSRRGVGTNPCRSAAFLPQG